MARLKFKSLWIVVGLALVVFVVYSSLIAQPVQLNFTRADKTMHIVGYFALMGWFVQIYHDARPRASLAIAFVSMGVGLEFAQDAGGTRFFEYGDMLANAIGVLLAWVLSVTRFCRLLLWFEERLLRAA